MDRLKRALHELRTSHADKHREFRRWADRIGEQAYSTGWVDCYAQCIAAVEDEIAQGAVGGTMTNAHGDN